MRSAEEYLAGLQDGREVWFKGERVEDVTAHPTLGVAARHAAIDFHGPSPDPSPFYKLPHTAEDLRERSRLIEESTTTGETLVVLVKEIGTDALFALHRVIAADKEAYGRVTSYYEQARDADLAIAVAQTDVKGDRAKGPGAQADPDLYLRVVDRRDDGIVVRGAKVHTSCAPNADEIIVIPTRALGEDEAEWAVAFAVPVATPGLRLICSNYLDAVDDGWSYPISSRHKMMETLTIFDDVFVPWDRVFLLGDTPAAGHLALTFVEHHRFTATSYKLPLVDALVGLAMALAEANGISRAGHVRDKLTWLIGYAETVRGLTHLAADRGRIDQATGIAYPDPMTTNLAKWTFARDYQGAVERVIDIAGGLLVTGPSGADWDSAELRPFLEKYLVGAVPASERVALLNLASELLTREYAGYQSVLAVHAEGSVEAEKLTLFRSYDPAPAVAIARRLAGV